jgi:hypothetical protein
MTNRNPAVANVDNAIKGLDNRLFSAEQTIGDLIGFAYPSAFIALDPLFSLSRNTTGNTSVQVGDVLNFTPIVGRRYRVSFHHQYIVSTAILNLGTVSSGFGFNFVILTNTEAGDALAEDNDLYFNSRGISKAGTYELNAYWQPASNTPVALNVLARIELSLGTGGAGDASGDIALAGDNAGTTMATLTVHDVGPAIPPFEV